MFQVTISGKTKAELLASASDLIALLGDAKTAPLTATEQSRLRADATVVPPKQPTAAEKKAAKAAAEKAAAEAAAAEEADGEAEGSEDDDVLEEKGDETEALTHDDVKALLIAVREAYPKKTTIIKEIVTKFGKAEKISEVDGKNLAAVAGEARRLLAAAK